MVSTSLKHISQIASFPQVRLKTKNLWTPHLVKYHLQKPGVFVFSPLAFGGENPQKMPSSEVTSVGFTKEMARQSCVLRWTAHFPWWLSAWHIIVRPPNSRCFKTTHPKLRHSSNGTIWALNEQKVTPLDQRESYEYSLVRESPRDFLKHF